MTMIAFDADDPATDNAALRYNIVRQSPGNPSSDMFYIDAEKGDIVTAISPMLLDREVGCLANSAFECMPVSGADPCLCEEGVHVSGPHERLSISTFN